MPLDQLANVAEISAAALLIVSLIYVGLQVRLSAQATYAATNQAHAEVAMGYIGLINGSNDLADVLHQGARSLSPLKEGNLIRFLAFHDQVFVAFQSFYLQYLKRTLDERIWHTYKHAMLDLLVQGGSQEWWELRKHVFCEDFRNYVEDLTKREQGKPMHPGSVAG